MQHDEPGIGSEVSTKIGTCDLVVEAVCDGAFEASHSVRSTWEAQMLLSQNVLNDRGGGGGGDDDDDLLSPLRSSVLAAVTCG